MHYLMLFFVTLTLSTQTFASGFANNSLFHTTVQLNDQNAASFSLSQQQGQVQVVAFVYTHCTSVCPIIVADLKRLEGMLPKELKNDVHFILVSLDPENDSSISMNNFLQQHNLTSPRWHFVRSDDDGTRELALLFDVRYRQDTNEIAHSNMISVLDRGGVLLYQRKGNEPLNIVVNVIRQALANTPRKN